ncbi:MAG: type II secretion system protein E [Armatimonadota bacterium]|nr:MAG: type II secretion system protein E [Armatimonadota bacterium]
MVMTRKDLGDILLSKGAITEQQLQQAREAARATRGADLGRILVDLEMASEAEVAEARAEERGIPFVSLANTRIDPSAVNIIPERLAKRHNVVPFGKMGNQLLIAMADPDDIVAMDDLRTAAKGLQIKPFIAAPEDITNALTRAYGGGNGAEAPGGGGESAAVVPAPGSTQLSGTASIREAIAQYGGEQDVAGEDEDADALAKQSEEAPIIKIAHSIILQAIKDGASDIHVEPERRGVRVRYRVDGVLHETMTVPKYIQAPLISRLKIMANMNIAERRIPQDGAIPIRADGKDYDLRVSCLPTIYGEKIVMRILDKTNVLIGLAKLGFLPHTQARVEELISQPNGMFLTTGPTGSGKTTTQYSVLHKINSVDRNIITIEDPVEYQLDGISQVQVHKKAGLTFASALRAFLRQDPDIIMVGEMRDLETAEIAIEAALTGHLVLSTLHTNDAPSAVTRMVDMGVEPYLISATVIGCLAQRLARRICPKCRESYEVDVEDLRRFGYHPENHAEMVRILGEEKAEELRGVRKVTLWRGAGCDNCRQSGFRGRLGIYSLMEVNDEIQDLIVRRAPLSDLREAAKANGMLELREDGLVKVLEGITTAEEVMRVVFTAGVS